MCTSDALRVGLGLVGKGSVMCKWIVCNVVMVRTVAASVPLHPIESAPPGLVSMLRSNESTDARMCCNSPNPLVPDPDRPSVESQVCHSSGTGTSTGKGMDRSLTGLASMKHPPKKWTQA